MNGIFSSSDVKMSSSNLHCMPLQGLLCFSADQSKGGELKSSTVVEIKFAGILFWNKLYTVDYLSMHEVFPFTIALLYIL